jgi:3-oxoacyl-[acyl-carrier-protein] synthase II
VTGLGCVSPLGLNTKETWDAALNGQSGISNITQFDSSALNVHFAGEVKNFSPDPFIPKKEQKKMERFCQFGVAAADMAIKDSGIHFTEELKDRTGVIVGAGIGGLPEIEETHKLVNEKGPGRISPFFIPQVILNMAAGQISILHGFRGPNFSVTSACATGCHSIGEAMNYIRTGQCDVMVAGGSESTVCLLGVGGFAAMKALSTRNDSPKEASRPWDKDRDGFVLGEGGSVLILEEYEHAKKRGARIYAEALGYGVSSDAYHMTNPSQGGVGASKAMQNAINDAEISSDKINYVNAHGTSTPAGDLAETGAIKNVFGPHAKKLWVSSTKSMMGHTLGAAGAIESLISVLSVYENKVPPTINLNNPSPDCDLDYVPHSAREGQIQYALNNSFGFGGTNACLVFSKI